jgi:lipoprotein-releasing system ATP-binding protein
MCILALKARDIHKSYKEGVKEVKVLKGLELEVKKEEIVVVLGPSGSGKTTLIHILGGLDKPDKGCVIIDDVNLVTLSDSELSKIRNKKIGFIFQFHQLLPEFTVFENVKLPAMIGRNKDSLVDDFCIELLDLVGLKGKEHRHPYQLSGGERQRVGVARALINKPKIILADEPSGNLDPETSKSLHALFLQLKRERGVTFVIATHKETMAKIADRVLQLKEGRLN